MKKPTNYKQVQAAKSDKQAIKKASKANRQRVSRGTFIGAFILC